MSCGPTEENRRTVSKLDSLSGTLAVLQKMMDVKDSLTIGKSLETFESYRVFIKYNIGDTLSSVEAENIKRFFQSAWQLEAFQNKRPLLKQRCVLQSKQIANLKQDALNQIYGEEQLKLYLEQELKAGTELNAEIFTAQSTLDKSWNEFMETKALLETFLRSKNEGKLPQDMPAKPTH